MISGAGVPASVSSPDVSSPGAGDPMTIGASIESASRGASEPVRIRTSPSIESGPDHARSVLDGSGYQTKFPNTPQLEGRSWDLPEIPGVGPLLNAIAYLLLGVVIAYLLLTLFRSVSGPSRSSRARSDSPVTYGMT